MSTDVSILRYCFCFSDLCLVILSIRVASAILGIWLDIYLSMARSRATSPYTFPAFNYRTPSGLI